MHLLIYVFNIDKFFIHFSEFIFSSLYGDQARYFEPEHVPKLRHTRIGIVSMVNNGAGMLGSQFFITLGKFFLFQCTKL